MNAETNNVSGSSIKYHSLPDTFIDRVKGFMAVIADVDDTPLQTFLDSFQRDLHPETELETWEKIAAAYQWAVAGIPGLTREQKKDVFTVILGLSMGVLHFDNVKNLTNEQVGAIISHFQTI